MNALVTNIINNLIHILWFYSLVLEPRYSRGKTVGIVAGAGVVSQFCMVLILFPRYAGLASFDAVPAIAAYFGGYCVTALVFGGVFVFLVSGSDYMKSLFLLSAYYSLWTLIYLIVSIVTHTFAGAGNGLVWGLRVGLNLSALLLYNGLFKEKLRRMYKEIQIGFGTAAMVSVFTFYLMTVLILYHESVRRRDLLYIVMILSTGVMAVMVHVQLLRAVAQAGLANRVRQMELYEKYLRAQISSYEKLEQDSRQTRHDFRHHNMVVAEYARAGNCQGILSYLQEYEAGEEEKYGVAFCRNHVVNNVLAAYVGRARREGVEVCADVRLGETKGISNYDLVSIFANVLENAVNACGKETGKTRMEISLSQRGDKLVFVCRNTCTGEVCFKDGLPCNKERVGIGVKSILSSVEKYDGSVNFSAADGMFTCQIIFQHSGSKK